jgi:hypothetical protein
MRKKINRSSGIAIIAIAAIVLIANLEADAQKSEFVQATAMGTSTQLGRVVNVDLGIGSYSTVDERNALLQAFSEKGSEGLANALDKMKSKGYIAITGTLGFDVNFIRSFNLPDGTRIIRFVTDRPIRFGEAWSSSRTLDYTLSMGEIIISKEKGKSTGKLYPVARFTLDKENELTVETFQNPWNLTNIRVRN